MVLDHCRPARHHAGMLVYKILRVEEWHALQSQGETPGAPVDVADGFIHFSTASQAAETAAKWFADMDGLMLLALDGDALGEPLKWEPSRGGDLFPHLYGPLRMADVLWAEPLPVVNGRHVFPERMT